MNKTQRQRKDSYHSVSDKIPLSAWLVGLLLLATVFGLVPLLAWVMQ